MNYKNMLNESVSGLLVEGKYPKLGEIKKLSPKWYRIAIKYSKPVYNLKNEISVIDISKKRTW